MSAPGTGGEADGSRALLLGLLLVALVAAAIGFSARQPAPVPADAPPERYSATRAAAALAEVLGDQAPHPVGSAANAQVRDRIVAVLTRLGHAPEIQRAHACDERGACASVENIALRIEGREPGDAVMLAAHYDSVPAGPGAADDGSGVASVLEIARLLRAQARPRHDIILLLTDGEELGLLGARAFVDAHPWAQDVRAVVNIEARGSAGASMLFETGSDNAWTVRRAAGLAATPITNSIFYTAYKLLPNDTDFSIFRRPGWQGYNYAFVGQVQHYHTPLDDLAHLSLASLQQQGAQALASLLDLAEADLPPADAASAATGRDAVYFDVLGIALLHWPATAALPAALLTALLALAVLLRLRRTGRLPAGALAHGGIATLVAPMLAGAGGAALIAALRAGAALPPAGAGYGWIANPAPLLIAMAATALLALVLTGWMLGRRAGFWGLWLMTAALLNLAGLASAAWLPGLSFVFLLPGLAALVAVLPALRSAADQAGTRGVAALVPLAVSLIVWLPTLSRLYETLGLDVLPGLALLLAWTGLWLLPLLATAAATLRTALAGLVAATVAVAGAFALAQPVYSVESPQRVNLEYWHEPDRAQSEWLLRPDSGQGPDALAALQPFAARATALLPWQRGTVWSAPAPAQDLPAPSLSIEAVTADGASRIYRARLRSPRGAPMARVCFAPGTALSALRVGGTPIPAATPALAARISARRAGWQCLSEHTLEAAGVVIEFRLAGGGAPELLLSDWSPGLPDGAQPLLQARRGDLVASQDGDGTTVITRQRLAVTP